MKQQLPPNLSSYSSRLRHLHNIISLVPDEQFDLKSWNRCGTIGCAIGWATQDPAFQLVGFSSIGTFDWKPVYYDRKKYDRDAVFGFKAIRKFFGITKKEAKIFMFFAYGLGWIDLFRPIIGKHKQRFLNRLEKLIEKVGAREYERESVQLRRHVVAW